MFQPEREIEHIVAWIQKWFEENGPKASAVIGISGGKDSSVCAALLMKALGKDRVMGVLMPDNAQSDIEDSYQLVDHLGMNYMVINIGEVTRAMKNTLSQHFMLSSDTSINIPPRIRMTVLYAAAQSMPMGGRVANTCNKSEDYIGYSTKYGDAAGDFSILSDYTVTEVRQIGDALGLPKELVHKTPSDGLSGKSDEDKIGFSYDTLDRYIREGICEDEETRKKIDRMHVLNLHKLKTIPSCKRLDA